MNDKVAARPDWVEKAAAEIACISAMRSKDVEAIIEKHRPPEEKAWGELLKVSRRLSEWVRGLAGERLKEDVRKLLEDFEAALAEYERVKEKP